MQIFDKLTAGSFFLNLAYVTISFIPHSNDSMRFVRQAHRHQNHQLFRRPETQPMFRPETQPEPRPTFRLGPRLGTSVTLFDNIFSDLDSSIIVILLEIDKGR